MNNKTTKSVGAVSLVMIFGVLVLAAGNTGQAEDPGVLLRSAIEKEEVDGDLQGAIDLYKQIVAKHSDSRAVAAKALVRLGGCYEKLGEEQASLAKQAFQKVVEDYPDQKEAVSIAREKLSLLSRSRAATKTGAAAFSMRQVWAGPGVDITGSVSPDGQQLSFVDWETGDLAVRDLASGTNHRLTNKGAWAQSSEMALFSKWSRDGRRIAYLWYDKDNILELRVYDLKNSSIRTIYRNKTPQDWVQAFDWSPDGRYVLTAFWIEATPTQSRKSRLGLISVEDNSVKELRCHFETLAASEIRGGFAFSADGRFVAYDAPRSDAEPGRHDIYLISLDNETEWKLVEHPADDAVVAWPPDGRGLLFNSDRRGSLDLWFLPMSEGKPQGSPRLVKSGIGAIDTLGITSRGEVYYGLGGRETDVYVADLGQHKEDARPPVKKLALPFQGQNQFPDYSPDGQLIAYLSTPVGRGRIVGLYSQDTGRVRELNLGLPGLIIPRWIPPDNRALSVAAVDKEGRRVLYRVDVQTGDSVPIVQMERGLMFRDGPVWAKDGKKFFYTAGIRSEEKRYIYVYNLETGKHEKLSGSPDDACFIAISPDGKWLALVNEHGKKVLRIMPTAGGEPREVYSFEHQDTVITPAWSADGRSIYFPRLQDLQGNIWDLCRVPMDGGEAKKIDLGLYWVRYLTVHPNGRNIAFSSVGDNPMQPQVWVMENFLPK